MYKNLSAQDYKSFLGLPSDYKVDGMLCYGTWDKNKHIEFFKEILKNSEKIFSFGTLPNFLEKMLEINIGNKKYWFDVSYGGALLSEYLHLACLFGSEKNILLGSCGGLSYQVECFDFIMPTYSWGNESTTRMYDPAATDNKHYANHELRNSLKEKVNKKYRVWEGATITCQAIMAETLEDVENWSKEGYFGVEMEAATVFSVSKHFNVPSAAILIVADNLIQGENVTSETYKNKKLVREEITKEQYRVALEELLN